jgi:uncharacterized membrane protein YoaK (UPF0700 family)
MVNDANGRMYFDDSAMCMLSLACGLQNGMTTFYSGAIIRTTHVTGTLTGL